MKEGLKPFSRFAYNLYYDQSSAGRDTSNFETVNDSTMTENIRVGYQYEKV